MWCPQQAQCPMILHLKWLCVIYKTHLPWSDIFMYFWMSVHWVISPRKSDPWDHIKCRVQQLRKRSCSPNCKLAKGNNLAVNRFGKPKFFWKIVNTNFTHPSNVSQINMTWSVHYISVLWCMNLELDNFSVNDICMNSPLMFGCLNM